jgi:D-hydroxyproline dehydrogenase subunit gamma
VRCPDVSISFGTGGSMFKKLHDPRGEVLMISIDGVPVAAEADESIAAVLLRQTPVWSRSTPLSGGRRAPYCMMGVCFDCLAKVDGVSSIQTCLVPVRNGMRINRQRGRPCVTP